MRRLAVRRLAARRLAVRGAAGQPGDGDVEAVMAEAGSESGGDESGRFSLPVAQTFPLADVATAHRAGEQGHVRGKLVLLVG